MPIFGGGSPFQTNGSGSGYPQPGTGGAGGGSWYKGGPNLGMQKSSTWGGGGMGTGGGAAAGQRGQFGGGTGNLQQNFTNNFDKQSHTARDFNRDWQDLASEQYQKTQGLLKNQQAPDQQYLAELGGHVEGYRQGRDASYNSYMDQSQKLSDEARSQGEDAQQTYTGTLRPAMKNNMENLGREASGAMTLQQAGDPNNATASGVRNMYDQQAQGYRTQGLQDAGVLNALGANAFAGQMGNGGPMTGAQMQLGQSQALQQGGQAYAAAQRQMDRLHEQGIGAGMEESGRQYERGQGARDRYASSQRDFSGAEDAYTNRMQGLRGERNQQLQGRFDAGQNRMQDDFGLYSGMANAKHGLASDQNAQQLAAMGDYYGTRMQGKGLQYQGQMAQQGGMMGAAGSALPFLMG